MPDTIFYITPSVEMLGARISLVELLSNIDRNRYRPVVICHRDGPLLKKLADIDVKTHIVRFGNWRKVKYWPLIPFALRELISLSQQENVKLWHSNEFWSYPYARLAANRTGIPAISHFRCSRTHIQIPPRKIKNYLLPSADAIITVSKAQKRLFKEFSNLENRIRVIYNGVDFQRFKDADGLPLRAELKLKPDQLLIGIVGPVSEHKGVEDFIRAARFITQKYPDSVFLIVGPDRPRAFLEKMKLLVSELNIGSSIRFTGFRKDIPEIMSALDFLITPSRIEAFGRVLLEGMAAGTPVIASQVGGIPEIISTRDLGVLVPPNSPDKLSSAVFDLMNDNQRRNRIIRFAQEHVKAHFSIESHTREIEEVYEHFLTTKTHI